MQNTITKTIEISVAVSIAFKDFNFVVAAIGKAVSNWRRKPVLKFRCFLCFFLLCTYSSA